MIGLEQPHSFQLTHFVVNDANRARADETSLIERGKKNSAPCKIMRLHLLKVLQITFFLKMLDEFVNWFAPFLNSFRDAD